jgi:RNA polymerase sigma-70 factor, ECF subfamily
MTTCVPEIDAAPSTQADDRERMLIERLRLIAAGNDAAMGAFYDATHTMVYALARRVLGDATDAEEVTLDVYMQVWRSAARYNPRRGTVAGWLLMMARSRAIDRRRASGKPHTMWQLFENDVLVVDLVAPGVDPEEEALAGAERTRIRSAMQALTFEQRLAIHLSFFRGLTHRELADHLGEPLGTIKTRIRSALRRLRTALDDGVPRDRGAASALASGNYPMLTSR